jgi:hypothetical protein
MKPPAILIIFFSVAVVALISWTIYSEIDFHYLQAYDGVILEKLQIPPKKMPDLVIKGAKTTFPCEKWKGLYFDSVKVGDSIVKRKHESYAYYYKKLGNGKYAVKKLEYWTF